MLLSGHSHNPTVQIAKKMDVKLILLLLVNFAVISYGRKSYEGWQVYRTAPLTKLALEGLHKHVFSDPKFQVWSQPILNRPAEIVVCPKSRAKLLNTLKKLNLSPKPFILNIEKFLEKERKEIENIKKQEIYGLINHVTFERYMDFTEITDYLNEVAANYPSIASLETIGSSFEGRPQTLLKLSNGSGSNKKIGVFINAAIHASDWIGPAVALNAIHQLTTNLANNQAFLDMANWYILPVANPDGYVYSWDHDRLWRKTRRPNKGSKCVGADPNRNFDVHWGEGRETNPCVAFYQGPNVFSEVESKNIADYLIPNGLDGNLHLYMVLHTYGQVLLHPYGYTTDPPINVNDLALFGSEAASALKAVRGTKYEVSNITNAFYHPFGNSKDFAYDQAEIPFTYTWELPGGGENSHDVPLSEIKFVVEETWEAFKSLVQSVYIARKNL
ncbi:carboxypeptidase B-like [Cloeon dipterum]|uniref:carboxypeptidase B-like n=1 Tax=Cloeon dipterum TaxID=197152 RepID=UPI00321F77ED